jgi:hypothetical protein
MKRDGLSFTEAAKALGAWDGHANVHRPPPTVAVRFLVCDYVIDGVPYRAEVRDEPKDDLQRTRWFYHEAADRLTELRQGDPAKFEGEQETQWGILAAAWELIQMEAANGI